MTAHRVSIVLPIAPSSTAEEFGRWPSWRAAEERMDAEQFRAALTDLLGAQPPLNPLIRDSSASALTTWHADVKELPGEPIVWRSIDVVTAPDDHKVQRVGQEERHARQRFVVITGTAEGEVLTAWNVKELRDAINVHLRDAGLPAQVFPGGFVADEAILQRQTSADPTGVIGGARTAVEVRTPVGSDDPTDVARHVARVHLALLALRQETTLRHLEALTRTLRDRYDRHSVEAGGGRSAADHDLRWAGLRRGEALRELADIGSALSTFRSEIWVEDVPRWAEGALLLAEHQSALGLGRRLNSLERVADSWASALTVSHSLESQQEEAEMARRRDRLEQAVAGIAIAALVLTLAAIFVDPAGAGPWHGIAWSAVAAVLALIHRLRWGL